MTLCLKPSTNLACFPEETASTEVDRSEPADSAPGPRRRTARGRGSGLVVARAQGRVRGGKRGARGGGNGAAVGQQQGRVSGRPIVTPARMNL